MARWKGWKSGMGQDKSPSKWGGKSDIVCRMHVVCRQNEVALFEQIGQFLQ